MIELRTDADTNIANFGLIESLRDVFPAEEPDAAKPVDPTRNKFGAMEDLTDLPRPEGDIDESKPVDPTRNKFGAMEDLTDLPRPEESPNYREETFEFTVLDGYSPYTLFHSIDEFSNGDSDNIQGTSGNDYLEGEHYLDDAIFGAGGADTLKGLDGDDFLFGGTGNDKLYGGRDSDWLEGNSGNDLLVGHSNSGQYDYYEVDTLIGGSGADTFSLVIEGPEFEVPYLDGLGEHAYAIIRDFKKADGDAILMVGKKQDYEFVSGYYGYGNALTKDTKIFYEGDMIAVVSDNMAADLTLSFV
ncbi:MAG: calcium-binding protein [Microcoleus sp. SU_5_3]|nr:calcium-binding protein [Microcoleus sp. SU_5_3]